MTRFLFSGFCHGLCWVGKFLLVHFSPVMFAPLIWLLLIPASIASLAWFLYDVQVFWNSLNEPFLNPADEARRESDARQALRDQELLEMTKGIRSDA